MGMKTLAQSQMKTEFHLKSCMGTEEVGKKDAELKIDVLCSSVLSILRTTEKQL